MQVSVSVGAIQLTLSIAIMQVKMSAAIMHFLILYCNYAGATCRYSYVGGNSVAIMQMTSFVATM